MGLLELARDSLLHGGDAVDRYARRSLVNGGAQLTDRYACSLGAHNHVHCAADAIPGVGRHLRDGKIELGQYALIETPGANVSDYADHFVPRRIRSAFWAGFAACEPFADRILPWPHRAHQGFVHEHDQLPITRVL